MNNKVIITNNPLLKEKNMNLELIFVESLADVYFKSRDLIHQNWKLISHPLAGSVKPAKNPYRSIILAQSEKLDFYSLQTIENSLQKLKQFNKKQKKKEYSQRIRVDYQLIDLSLLNSALDS
jgi:hypothetical protein